MAVKIRLSRVGKRKHPVYRIIATQTRGKPKVGRPLEILGVYDPVSSSSSFQINKGRIDYWLKNGAQLSDTVRHLLKM